MSAIMTSIVCGLIINISFFTIIKRIMNSKIELSNMSNLFFILALSIMYAVIYNEGYSVLYTIANYLSIMLFNKIIFKENMKNTIISTIIALLIIMLADFINSLIIINFFSLEQIRSCWYVRIISNMIVAIVSIALFSIKPVVNKCRYFYQKINNKDITIILLFIILVVSIVVVTFNMSKKLVWNADYFANFFVVITLIIFCYIFINENNEFNILNEKYDSLFNYVQTFENWIEKEQLNRHEYKNQLASIRCITKEKKVRDKIDSIMLDNINITNDTVNQLKPIPNGGLKGLLYYKIAIAENNKLNIELDISIKNPNIIKKLTEDKIKILCRLLGIYLDNAIEAAKETKKKIISIEIYEVDKNINIVITNTFDNTNDISKRNDKGFTTKGQGHGKGLYFAKKMIDKSNWLEESQSILEKYYIQRLIIKNKKQN